MNEWIKFHKWEWKCEQMLHCHGQFHNLQNFISQPSSSSSMHSPMFPCPGLGCWLQLLRSPVPALALAPAPHLLRLRRKTVPSSSLDIVTQCCEVWVVGDPFNCISVHLVQPQQIQNGVCKGQFYHNGNPSGSHCRYVNICHMLI